MAFTPGPNNILLTASGVNFGFARTVPHLLGVDVGFVVLLAVFAAGLGIVFAALPASAARAENRRRRLHAVAGLESGERAAGRGWRKREYSGQADDIPAGRGAFSGSIRRRWWPRSRASPSICGPATSARISSSCSRFSRWPRRYRPRPGPASAWRCAGFLRDPVHARIFNAVMGLLLVASIYPIVTD